jgi:hypothetical protein
MDLSSEEKKRAFQKKYPVDYEDYDFENSSHQYTLSSDSGDESSDDE